VRHLIVGTAGHIDHGKSSLVQRLTGIDPDRLKEEKSRGITIELGFADLDVGSDRVLSFVDVPGHERFVRHMVAGATGIDAVLLVVAADEGVKPQTREHLDICRLLDVHAGAVALTKADLVEPDLLEVVKLELQEYLQGSFLESAPVVGVSSRTGEGIEALRLELTELFDRAPPRDTRGVARLPVDRSFVMKGFGTVVTGSLVSGSLVHRRAVREARAGQRTAVNLQGLACEDAPRGSTLVRPAAMRATRRVWAEVRLLGDAPETLQKGGTLRLHQGTGDRRARLRILEEGDGGLSGIVFLDRPTVLAPDDRFILRRPAPVNTVGGGRVLDAHPPRRRPRPGELEALQAAGPVERISIRLARAGLAGIALAELAVELAARPEEIAARVEAMETEGLAVRVAGLAVSGEDWRSASERVASTLEAFHTAEPLRPGMSREELRGRVGETIPQESWRFLLEQLAASGMLRLDGESVALAAHRVVLSGPDLDLSRRIEAAFREAGLDPPDLDAVLAGEDRGRAARVSDLLLGEGRLVKIRSGRLFHAGALAGLVDKLREYRRTSATIDVAGFKQLAGVTRRNAIPLLEHLDEQRLTRRVGNVREILDV
jgi:selenocysteine-specific elongation factor